MDEQNHVDEVEAGQQKAVKKKKAGAGEKKRSMEPKLIRNSTLSDKKGKKSPSGKNRTPASIETGKRYGLKKRRKLVLCTYTYTCTYTFTYTYVYIYVYIYRYISKYI